MTPEKNFRTGPWLGSRDPVNFWALNANRSKMAKDTNFNFGMHAPRGSPDMTLKKNFRKGVWLESRDPVNCRAFKC